MGPTTRCRRPCTDKWTARSECGKVCRRRALYSECPGQHPSVAGPGFWPYRRSSLGLSGRCALGSDGLSASCRCGGEQLHAAGCPGRAPVDSCDQALAMDCRATWLCLAAWLVALALEVCDRSASVRFRMRVAVVSSPSACCLAHATW